MAGSCASSASVWDATAVQCAVISRRVAPKRSNSSNFGVKEKPSNCQKSLRKHGKRFKIVRTPYRQAEFSSGLLCTALKSTQLADCESFGLRGKELPMVLTDAVTPSIPDLLAGQCAWSVSAHAVVTVQCARHFHRAAPTSATSTCLEQLPWNRGFFFVLPFLFSTLVFFKPNFKTLVYSSCFLCIWVSIKL
eukprot:m.88058 g.88058  ORF g.88058 m.88058 type:complete len:192 (+) comp8799_c2_seq2:1524-2099(+)